MSITPPAEGTTPTIETVENAPSPAAPNITDKFTGIPQEFAGDPMFEGYTALPDVLNEFKTLKTVQSQHEKNGLVPFIGEDSPPEAVQAFYEKLGKPKAAAEYDLKPPEDLPQGLDFSDEAAAEFAQFAFDNNLTKAQAAAGFELWNQKMVQMSQGMETAKEESLNNNLAVLEEIWGGPAESEKFKANEANAHRAFNFVADSDLSQKFKDDPMIASNPLVLEVLSRLGAKMSPDTVPTVGASLPATKFNDTQASAERAVADFHSAGKFKQMTEKSGTEEGKKLMMEWKDLQTNLRKQLTS